MTGNDVFSSSEDGAANEGGAIAKLRESGAASDPKSVSPQQWKSVLSDEAFHVTRQAGTEAPFVGKFDKHFDKGMYTCHCCGAKLFE